ncbi:hypothetical protein DEU56DRAFT_760366 [Suillus clintonianus]|uniref:uncharacterized protein n=1 Tax=Suillus clintonianus TaxID=1904413 RepID=UPI001B87FADF|nr:uncharacterized protein DEU56DRAFT_760366 [Suillus clintonianus]KAG2122338.1 hypothetical protein DEU56DRAFT_760366 [Suillus clintonianus]
MAQCAHVPTCQLGAMASDKSQNERIEAIQWSIVLPKHRWSHSFEGVDVGAKAASKEESGMRAGDEDAVEPIEHDNLVIYISHEVTHTRTCWKWLKTLIKGCLYLRTPAGCFPKNSLSPIILAQYVSNKETRLFRDEPKAWELTPRGTYAPDHLAGCPSGFPPHAALPCFKLVTAIGIRCSILARIGIQRTNQSLFHSTLLAAYQA